VRVPRRPVAIATVVFAACVATVHTSSTQDQVIALNGSAMLTYPFGVHQVNVPSGSATLIITEATVGGSDVVTGIYLGSGCGSEFWLTAPPPMTPVGSGSSAFMGSVPIDGMMCAGSSLIVGGTGTGSTATCDSYTFYATFEPHAPVGYMCNGNIGYMTGGSSFTMAPFVLTGSGAGSVTPDAAVDAAPADSGSGSGSGNKDGGTGGSSSETDRQTYYACSTGAPAGAAPVALALVALRRRRKLRA